MLNDLERQNKRFIQIKSKGGKQMKKNKIITFSILGVLILVLAAGALMVFLLYPKQEKETVIDNSLNPEIRTFAEWTKCEVFQNVPAMIVEQTSIGQAEDFGDGNWLIDVNGTSLSDYQEYVKLLEDNDFTLHSNNGEEGMEGYVYTSTLSKEDLTVVVSHAVKMDKTYITGCIDEPISDRMIYKDSYVENIAPGAQTKVHMLELNDNGNSYVIQLKNGHFVIEDGGLKFDAPYLLDYLEGLVPPGEKPVIEGWFISHPHDDHHGALVEISTNSAYGERVYVEGIYFTEPSEKIFKKTNENSKVCWYIKFAKAGLLNTEGGKPDCYRMHLGQRYYFCDIIIDVPLTIEQMPFNTFYGDFNDTSTWLMHHIEGQRFVHGGDAYHNSQRMMTYMYDKEYMDVEVFSVLHHGINVYDYFIDFCKADTLLYPGFMTASLWEYWDPTRTELVAAEGNDKLKKTAKEAISHGDGTVVLTFPYKVGTAKIMKPSDWRYNNGKPVRDAGAVK